MMQTVLITGIAGFIGSHLAERLVRDGVRVVGIKRSGTDLWRIEHLKEHVSLYDADQEGMTNLFREHKVDAVIHLATHYIKHHTTSQETEEMLAANVVFPTTLCEYAIKQGVRYWINTGTFFEYDLSGKEPLQETSPEKSYNFYAATKRAFSDILRYFADTNQLTVVDCRLFAPFGEKDNEKLVLFLIKSLLQGVHIDFSGGEQQWNFTYVGDIVEAYVKVLEKISLLSERYMVLNVGYDTTVTLQELAKKLEQIAGKQLDITWGAKPYIANEIFYANCDNSKLRKVFGWEQKFDIDSGLRRTFEYYAHQAR